MNLPLWVMNALGRVASASSVRLVRADEQTRAAHHGGSVADLNGRLFDFAKECEVRAQRLEADLG